MCLKYISIAINNNENDINEKINKDKINSNETLNFNHILKILKILFIINNEILLYFLFVLFL